jgi:hypothetical protein
MPIIGEYPEFYVNYKGEKVKRLPDSELPKLAPGMDDPYSSRNMNMREKYNENRRISRIEKARKERLNKKLD